MKLVKSLTIAAAMLSLGSQPALAHGSMMPQHGGVVQMSGEIMLELVTKPKALDIYVSEEDEPIPAESFDGLLIVTSAAGEKTRTALKPAGGNKFTAPGRPGSGSKVVISLSDKASGAKTFATFRMK